MLRQRRLIHRQHVYSCISARSGLLGPAIWLSEQKETNSHSSSPSTLLSSPSAGLPKQYLYTWVWTNWSIGISRCSRFGSYRSARYTENASVSALCTVQLTFAPACCVFRNRISDSIRTPASYPNDDSLYSQRTAPCLPGYLAHLLSRSVTLSTLL